MKKGLVLLTLFFYALTSWANEDAVKLSLDSCRRMAVQNNKEIKMSDAKKQKAYYERKAAFTKYFPRVTATGVYMFTSKQIELLSDEQKQELNTLGSGMTQDLMPVMQQMMAASASNPLLAGMMSQMMQQVAPMLPAAAKGLDAKGSAIAEATELDTRNIGVINVMLTQPIYMGGKIRAYNNITRSVEELTNIQASGKETDVVVEADEAYWRVVGLVAKKRLAENYLATVDSISKDVDKLIEAGFATKADGLSVKVKVNEAKVSVVQVNNGIALAKMLLCQICGLDMNTKVELEDEDFDPLNFLEPASAVGDVNTAIENRNELKSLDLLKKINDEKVKVVRSEFLPSAALIGGYTTTYPSCFDGFQKEFGGMWNVGVMVKVPVITCGERIYKVKAAREEAKLAEYQFDEAKEKIELQVSQTEQKLAEAKERLATAREGQDEAAENLRYAQVGMKEGMIPVSNVLQAETAFLKARTNLVEAEIDVLLAQVYLKKAYGIK